MPPRSHLLSLDLDAFVDPPAHFKADRDRLPDEEHTVWTVEAVCGFLEQRCGLSRAARRPGAVIVHHDEIMGVVPCQLQAARLTAPFLLSHVDAHADLGLGEPGWTELLHRQLWRPVGSRTAVGVLTPGNWLAFMIGFQWVDAIHHARQRYVSGEGRTGLRDVFPYFVAADGPDHIDFQLAPMHEDEPRSGDVDQLAAELATIRGRSAAEPCVRMTLQNLSQFQAPGPADFVVLCQSPGFTPPKADAIFAAMQEYIEIEPG